MNRVQTLLRALDLSQPQLGAWLRTSQSQVSRMVSGQAEPGPVSILLDQLEQVIDVRGLEVARAWVLSGAATPDGDAVAAESTDAAMMAAHFGGK